LIVGYLLQIHGLTTLWLMVLSRSLPETLTSSPSLTQLDVSVNRLDSLPDVYLNRASGLASSTLQYVALDSNEFKVTKYCAILDKPANH
jgi:Leucine-rich repeat (LRR) protein